MSQRVLMLIVLAVLAIVLYVIGFKTGTFLVVIVAACVELWFWVKLIVADKQENSHTDH